MEKKLEVLFLLCGLLHYFKFILNRLNQPGDLDIMLAMPRGRGAALGSGVQESREGADFQLFELEEHRGWYGKPAFRRLKNLLEKEQPRILVVGWPYIL